MRINEELIVDNEISEAVLSGAKLQYEEAMLDERLRDVEVG